MSRGTERPWAGTQGRCRSEREIGVVELDNRNVGTVNWTPTQDCGQVIDASLDLTEGSGCAADLIGRSRPGVTVTDDLATVFGVQFAVSLVKEADLLAEGLELGGVGGGCAHSSIKTQTVPSCQVLEWVA